MKTITQYILLSVALLPALFARAATLTVLHSFTVEEGQGVNGLLLGTDVNFYATAAGGGPGAVFNNGCGTISRMAADGSFTSLYSFSGFDGKWPGGDGGYGTKSKLVEGADGNFYGVTYCGGIEFNGDCYTQSSSGHGTIFRMTPDGTLTTLVFFDGTNGSGPSSLILAKDGNFYGTTYGGFFGSGDRYGTVFRMTPDGALTTLFSFNGTNGASPGSLIQGKDSAFYGTADTSSGGLDSAYLHGGIFKITPEGLVTPFVSFTDTNSAGPYTVMQASDGNFYGTMFQGGSPPDYGGMIFKVTPSRTVTNIVKFTFSNGAWPEAPLVEGTDGILYGSTSQGGPRTDFPGGGWDHVGTLFKVTPQGKLTTLVFFKGYNGLYPRGNLVQASDGNFYGTTAYRLSTDPSGWNGGEIFRLNVPGADAPKIISTAHSSSAVTLRWLALRGRSYQLQSTTDLAQTNWTNVGTAVAATNISATASDLTGGGPQRFYRVVLLP